MEVIIMASIFIVATAALILAFLQDRSNEETAAGVGKNETGKEDIRDCHTG